MIEKKELIAIRPPLPSDENFLFDTWLNALRYGNEWFEEINEKQYYKAYREIIRAILARAHIQIACLKSDPDVILAYSISEGPALHFLYTKEAWRGIGLANDLLPKDFQVVTHLTKVGRSIIRKKFPNVIFNPFWRNES